MSNQVPAPSDNPMPDVIRDAFLSQLKRYPTGCSVMVAGTGSGKTTAMAQAMLKIEAGVIETGEDAPWLSSNDKGWKCPKKCLAIIKGKEDRARLEEDLYKYLAIYEREGIRARITTHGLPTRTVRSKIPMNPITRRR